LGRSGTSFERFIDETRSRVEQAVPEAVSGRVTELLGLRCQCRGFSSPVGGVCSIKTRSSSALLEAEVIGFNSQATILMPVGQTRGIQMGDAVTLEEWTAGVRLGGGLLGRILDGRGRPIDDKPMGVLDTYSPVHSEATAALQRKRITERFTTGVRGIDGFLTCGKGQRIGVFSASGVGKSLLLGAIARNSQADVCVIALVGERSREVRDFIEKELGEAMQRSVVVAATSDEPAVLRVRSALVACTIAEYFRDQGADVLLCMDSLTRVAHAQRQIGLASGEVPSAKGYPPSVFALIPRIAERSGSTMRGSITGVFAVLVDSDAGNDPVGDCARSVLDGHIYLSRRLAAQGTFPAIRVTSSVSRLMPDVVDAEHLSASRLLGQLIATYEGAEDLLQAGAYRRGVNQALDRAVALHPRIERFIRQDRFESVACERSRREILELAAAASGVEAPKVQNNKRRLYRL